MGNKKQRVLVIGLDGASLRLIKSWASEGKLPTFKKMLEKGVSGGLRSVIPPYTPPAWTSFMTGKNPGKHGIFGFMDFPPGTYRLSFPNFNNLKSPPFWSEVDGTSVIINVPSTFPVKEMNGVHISGFVSLDLERSVWPTSLIPKLREMDYRLDVDSAKAHQSLELLLSQALALK